MAKYRKKPVVIEALTFDEVVQYAKENSDAPHWHFKINDYPVTHENDNCYIITTLEGMMAFTREDMLIQGVHGEIYPCKKDIFDKTYDSAQ